MGVSTIERGIFKYYIPLDLHLKANFYALHSHIFTIDEIPEFFGEEQLKMNFEHSNNQPLYGHLLIETESQLDKIDSVLETARYSRPRVLIILSVLSFLSGRAFTIYEIKGSRSHKLNKSQTGIPNKVEVSDFIIEGKDKSKDLLRLLLILSSNDEDTRRLAASLLDRWRKALYLKEQSDAQLYSDESLLAYFHILELLSNYYQEQLIVESENKLNNFLINLFSDSFKLRGNHLEQEKNQKFRQLRSLLLADGQLSVFSKICYSLDQLGMLDTKTQTLVSTLVKARNEVTHVRQVYQDKFIWPLPPFFPLDKDSDEHVWEIELLSARAIASHMGLDAWKEEWEDLHRQLHPPIEIIQSFIEKECFQKISSKQFIKGNYEGVRPSSIIDLYLSKKLTLHQTEVTLRSLLIDTQVNKNNAHELFIAALLFADSPDEKLSEKCKLIVIKIHEHEWIYYSNIKDILRYLEYRGFSPKWLRSWIESKDHVKIRK